MTARNPICVALDTPDLGRAAGLAHLLKSHVGFMKIGMEFFYAHGAKGYELVAAEGLPIFLDLKLHDIPNTVASAMGELMQLSPTPAIVNVHATGGYDMMCAARDAVQGKAKLIAVTILTSLSDEDIWQAGFESAKDSQAHARSLAELALRAGLDGVVCSSHDIVSVKHATSETFLTVVPGIRPDSTGVQDQKRVATPIQAMKAGADILVIGRAITGTADPVLASHRILESLNGR